MKKLFLSFFFFSITSGCLLYAQDTLPKFSLKNAGNNRIIIGWFNNYPNIRQISIQRSTDSLKLFQTILTIPDPTSVQNGYVDARAAHDHMFYRLFILLDKGVYLFTPSKRPGKSQPRDTARRITNLQTNPDLRIVNGKSPLLPPKNTGIKTDPLKSGDSLARPDPNGNKKLTDALAASRYDSVLKLKKSMITQTKPVSIKIDNIQWGDSSATPRPNHVKPPTNSFAPSLRVYTYRDGYVRIKLPDGEKSKKYSIKFFEDGGSFLFELKEIKEKDFKIDKANFYHAGWFRFELYENGKLLEKNKLYLDKDF